MSKEHKDLTSVHRFAIMSDSDPGAIGQHIAWLNTFSKPYILKVRNEDNTGWIDVNTSRPIVPKNTNFSITSAESGTLYFCTGEVVATLPVLDRIPGVTHFGFIYNGTEQLTITTPGLGQILTAQPFASTFVSSDPDLDEAGQFIELLYIDSNIWLATSATGVWAAE